MKKIIYEFFAYLLMVIALLLQGCGSESSAVQIDTPNNEENNEQNEDPNEDLNQNTPLAAEKIALINQKSIVNPKMAECAIHSNALSVVPAIPDAPTRLKEEEEKSISEPASDCQYNKEFRFGSGLYDITGVIANTNGMGWESPTQVFSGLHTRQYARAFSIESPCNNKRVLFISADVAMITGAIRQTILSEISADSVLSKIYGPDNIMISATHTHQGPGGYAHHEALNLFHLGYDSDVLNVITDGILKAAKIAHANIEAHPDTAPISLAIGELLNTNINRSLPAFVKNSLDERNEVVDINGEPVDNNKKFIQLNLVRSNSSAVGVINWFAVHGTVLGNDLKLVSADNKGFASQGFEKIMSTQYGTNGPLNLDGTEDNFVAAFAQTDEGDASPNLYIMERPFPDPTRGGGIDEYDSNRIAGTKQLAKSLELFMDKSVGNTVLSGGIDYRQMHVQFADVEITDPVVLDSLHHPDNLNTDTKGTCSSVLGPSFGAGAEDGPAVAAEGVSCSDSPEVIEAAEKDYLAAMGGRLPVTMLSNLTLCNLAPVWGLTSTGCHAEKPVFLITGAPLNLEANILPIQLFRIGNLAILGLPWEVTTISGRRLRKNILDILEPQGIDTVVIAGLSNDYAHYLTTREEYSSQQYEGGATLFGPWTLAAVQQESRRLAIAMRDNVNIDPGPDYSNGLALLKRPLYIPSDLRPIGTDFGDLLVDVPTTAVRETTVIAEFQTGHPRNDLKTATSYAYVEQQQEDGSFTVYAADYSPDLRFVWKPTIPQSIPLDAVITGTSTGEVQWTIPSDTPSGIYRLRLDGAAQLLIGAPQEYSGLSSPFEINGTPDACSF